MIKAIIFDCFGVLTVDGWLKFCDTYAKDPATRQEAHNLNEAVDRGEISYQDFISKISALTGVAQAEVDKQVSEPLPKNTELLDYIKELHKNYKTAILSNISDPNWFESYFTPNELEIFDEIVMSSKEGIIKPDPRIFAITTGRLGVSADGCVFVDDRQKNTDSAEELGMKSILYQDLKSFKLELKSYLVP
jgi:epoxide hydrolase-like predicted phosphatase